MSVPVSADLCQYTPCVPPNALLLETVLRIIGLPLDERPKKPASSLVEEQPEQDDNRNRNADQPEQKAFSHDRISLGRNGPYGGRTRRSWHGSETRGTALSRRRRNECFRPHASSRIPC